MISKEDLKDYGMIFSHISLKDSRGNPLKCRQNGKVKTWKKSERFLIPVKHGMYETFYITNENGWYGKKYLIKNDHEWSIA